MRRLMTLLSSLLVVLVLAPGAAAASTVQECQAKIDTLAVQTSAAAFLGPKAETGKLDPIAASALQAGADDALACVSALSI